MKQSQAFLGITSTLLAIAGMSAVKSHKFGNETRYYCTSPPLQNASTKCLPYVNAPFRTRGTLEPTTAKFTLGTKLYTMYTNASPTGKCLKTSPDGCSSVLIYRAVGV